MDNLQNEIAELKQFIAELKADRAATKEKEKNEAWTKYVSLTVVIIAVLGSIAAQWGGKFSSRTQLSQAQESDKWAYYQAQSIKQHLYEINRAQVVKGGDSPEAAKQQKEFDATIAKYEKRKEEITKEAKALEKTRNASSELGRKIGLAITFFSTSVAMASICMMTKKKPLWFIAMGLAGVAVVQMAMVWMAM